MRETNASRRHGRNSSDEEPGFLSAVPLWTKILAGGFLAGLLGLVIYNLIPEGPVQVDVHPINGTVKINGELAYGVHVYYWPVDQPEREFAFRHGIGITDKDGKYSIRSAAGSGNGLGAGKYKVTFEQYVDKNGKPITTLDKVEGSVIRTRIPRPHSDHDYPENSPHSAEVSSSQPNQHEFDLSLPAK